jgi:two-component system, OmpR family, sensor histidine kinase VicK
MSIKAQSKNV